MLRFTHKALLGRIRADVVGVALSALTQTCRRCVCCRCLETNPYRRALAPAALAPQLGGGNSGDLLSLRELRARPRVWLRRVSTASRRPSALGPFSAKGVSRLLAAPASRAALETGSDVKRKFSAAAP